MPCLHANVRLRSRGQPFEDSNIILMGASFYCADCGVRFRAIGVPDGVTHEAPGTVNDGEVTVFPLVPVGEEPRTIKVGRC